MAVAPSVDLAELARETDGFSGADLQALVYNAHLEVIHDTISSLPSESSPNGAGAASRGGENGEPVKYTALGSAAGEGRVLSRAEESAFQRRVRVPSVCSALSCPVAAGIRGGA